MLQGLAMEAEHKLPGPPPKVQKLHKNQKKRRRKLALVFLVFCAGLAGLVVYGVRNPGDMPLGLGGIFKAYVVGTKAPIPEPGQPLKPNQVPMNPRERGNR